MDLKEIKLIVDLMKRSDLREFEIEEEGFKLRICRGAKDEPPQVMTMGTATPFPPGVLEAAVAARHPAEPAPVEEKEQKEEKIDENIDFIKSPLVGTFYLAASPESGPFVEVGSSVSQESIVCIIEAMKVMNEIQAEMSATIIEILVENGKSVEYGQPLFKVKKT